MSSYLPRCCNVGRDCSGCYEVAHVETSAYCKHVPSGGTGGRPDGKTPCNRVIGHGRTRTEAIQDARLYLDLPVLEDALDPRDHAGIEEAICSANKAESDRITRRMCRLNNVAESLERYDAAVQKLTMQARANRYLAEHLSRKLDNLETVLRQYAEKAPGDVRFATLLEILDL